MSTHSLPFIATVALVVAATMRHETAHTEVAATAPSVVTITATDYAFQAPDTIAAGFTTFRLVNNSDQIHMAQLIRLEPGRTMDEYIEAYSESFRTRGPRPQWATRVGGPGAAPPHGTSNATQYLEPGRYLWVCNVNPPPDRIPHVMKRMAKAFVVRAAGATTPARTPPASDVVIQLIDFGFTVSPTLAPGRHTIRVENAGREPHEIGLMKLAPGTTEDSVRKVRDWMQNPDGPPPASVSAASLVGGISSLAAGGEAYFEADLTTGDYVLFCFVTAPDGRPHTAHGMVQHIRIAGAQEKPPLALTHVAVVNGADGSVKRDMTVLVHGSRIRAVGPTVGVSLPESAVVVNAPASTSQCYQPSDLSHVRVQVDQVHADCLVDGQRTGNRMFEHRSTEIVALETVDVGSQPLMSLVPLASQLSERRATRWDHPRGRHFRPDAVLQHEHHQRISDASLEASRAIDELRRLGQVLQNIPFGEYQVFDDLEDRPLSGQWLCR